MAHYYEAQINEANALDAANVVVPVRDSGQAAPVGDDAEGQEELESCIKNKYMVDHSLFGPCKCDLMLAEHLDIEELSIKWYPAPR